MAKRRQGSKAPARNSTVPNMKRSSSVPKSPLTRNRRIAPKK